jgi:hypothetical protein
MSKPRSTYDQPRRQDAVGLLTMLRTCARMIKGDSKEARKYRTWARLVKAVLDAGWGEE